MNLLESVESLINAFPSKGVTPATLAIYLEDLSDLPEPLVCGAIKHLRRTATFLPSIGEIRMLVAESVSGLPSEEEAWRQVRKALGDSVPGQDTSAWDRVHPLVNECVKTVGTYPLRHDDAIGTAQRHFRTAYRERREIAVKDMAAGTLPLPVPSGVVTFSAVPQLRAMNEAAS